MNTIRCTDVSKKIPVLEINYDCIPCTIKGIDTLKYLFIATTKHHGICVIMILDNDDKTMLHRYYERTKNKFQTKSANHNPKGIAPYAQGICDFLKGISPMPTDFPLDLYGTKSHLEVWKELLKIPVGEKPTYGDIAEKLGRNKGSSQFLGQANKNNPVPILVPCHRVVNQDEEKSKYGWGRDVQVALQRLDGVRPKSIQENLF